MQRILGYASRLSVCPGEALDFMISAPTSEFACEVHRIYSVDERPEGPGWKSEVIDSPVTGNHRGELQETVAGSYVLAPPPRGMDRAEGFTVALAVLPTLLPQDGAAMTIVSRAGGGRGWALGVDIRGFVLRYRDATGAARELRTSRCAPSVNVWTHLVFSVGPDAEASRTVTLTVRADDPHRGFDDEAEADVVGFDTGVGLLWFAAEAGPGGRAESFLEGKLTSPLVLWGAVGAPDRSRLLRNRDPRSYTGVAAAWDFAHSPQSTTIREVTGNGDSARTVQLPARAVTGPNWNGRVHDWKQDPTHYDAILFHSRDLEDAGWTPTLGLTVPDEWASGAYALKIQDGRSHDWVPFYVRAREAQNRVLFLAPTNTYLAYANQQYDNDNAESTLSLMKSTPIVGTANDFYLGEHPELGLSLYDLHPDGIGVRLSSAKRPILNWRPDYHAWLTDGPRHYTADFYILGWLDAAGITADIATDEDLDRDGLELLDQYDVVLTGSHPEYHSERMLDALEGFVARGGRLMYLGGNGFYWVTSYDPERRHVIEVRRGFAGNGDFRSPVGEAYHATTGEIGGIWRLRGRPPNRLVGVGYGANGWGPGRGYRRSDDGRYPWVFDGVAPGETIGGFGLILDAAGGDEVDRIDFELGSPPQTTVLASTEQFSDLYQPVMDDYTVFTPAQGGSTNPQVRADLTLYENTNGGAVFSTGSICWAGALAFNRYDNNVARVTENVLRGFLDRQDLSQHD